MALRWQKSSAEDLSTWRCVFVGRNHLSQRALQWNAAQRVKAFPHHFAHKLNNSVPCPARHTALRHTRIQWPRHCPFSTYYIGAPRGLGTVLDHVQALEWQSHVCVQVKEVLMFGLHCVQWNFPQKEKKKCRPSGCTETNTCFVGRKKRFYCSGRHVSKLMKEDVNWFAREVKALVSWIPVIRGWNCKHWSQGTSWPIAAASVDINALLHLSRWNNERVSLWSAEFLRHFVAFG